MRTHMRTHGGLTEDSRSRVVRTPDRKGREGKGVRKGRESCRYVVGGLSLAKAFHPSFRHLPEQAQADGRSAAGFGGVR
jgi:hypothetical protein